MKAILTYCIPFNLWHHYRPFVERFADRFKKYPPRSDYQLVISCHWGEPAPWIHELFYGTRARFFPYYADGCDVGATQKIAQQHTAAFVIGFPTHAYFHREGWLERLLEARKRHGPGLYSASGSFELRPHLRTCAYGLDSNLWEDYPLLVTSREQASEAECGENSLTQFVLKMKRPAVQVLWDSEQQYPHWRAESLAGIYRRGEQNAMLVFDRHTDEYHAAKPAEKSRLSTLADGDDPQKTCFLTGTG